MEAEETTFVWKQSERDSMQTDHHRGAFSIIYICTYIYVAKYANEIKLVDSLETIVYVER
jgi:hypothetical protein